MHCECRLVERRFARVARALGRVVLASGALVTLMACYGMVRPMARPGDDCGDDVDGDMYCVEKDCNDRAPDIFPGAEDPDLDGIDQNCDGVDGWRDPQAEVATDPAPAPEPTPIAAPP